MVTAACSDPGPAQPVTVAFIGDQGSGRGARAVLELIRELQGRISGLAVPQLVRENREGVREVLIPSYVTRVDEGGAEGANYRGERFFYPHLPPESG